MNYAIINGTNVTDTGTLQKLFPTTCFSSAGANADFLTENNVVELVQTLDYTTPTQKLTTVSPYYVQGENKAYNVRVDSTTSDEQAYFTNLEWSNVRAIRNSILEKTDWRASTDRTLSDAWRDYRQALRDVPSHPDPFNITWPTEPS